MNSLSALQPGARGDPGTHARVHSRSKYAAQVHAHFRPEFVNRVDEFVVFQPLQLGQIKQIVRLQVRLLPSRGRSAPVGLAEKLTNCLQLLGKFPE